MNNENNSERYLIVGLGNPGQQFRLSRHNFGFMLLDALAEEQQLPLKRMKFKAMIAEGQIAGKPVVLAKPLTFMNDSGQAVSPLLRYYKVSMDHLFVIHDDLDLPLGVMRIRASGSAGGQRGIASIIAQLNSQDFPRLRLGIGRPPGQMDPVDYVLEKFLPAEQELQKIVLIEGLEATKLFIQDGIKAAMNRYNGEVA